MYKWSVCDPRISKVQEKGRIPRDLIIVTFKDFPWQHHVDWVKTAKEREIHFSPSLEFRNEQHGRGVTFSAIEKGAGFIFYIFYSRPETITKMFGLIKSEEPHYTSDILDQSYDQAISILEDFVAGDYEAVRSRFLDIPQKTKTMKTPSRIMPK